MEKRWISAAVYARVSTKDRQTVDQQGSAIAPWVSALAVRFEVFEERESTKKRRPVLEALRARILAGEFDAIVCWRYDRIARSWREFLDWLDIHDRYGVSVTSMLEPCDLDTPSGRFQFRIFAAVAEFERDSIGQRVKRKLDELRKTGKVPGPRKGDRKQPTAYDPALALAHYKTGTVRELARILGVGSSTAHRARQRLIRDDEKQGRRDTLTRRFCAKELNGTEKVSSTPDLDP